MYNGKYEKRWNERLALAFYFASSIFEEKAAQIWASRKALSTEQKLWKISARREGEAEQVQHTYTPPHARRPRARNDFLFESIFARRRAPRRRKLRGISNEPHRYFTPEYFYFAMKDSEFCIGHPPTTRPHMKRGKIKKWHCNSLTTDEKPLLLVGCHVVT